MKKILLVLSLVLSGLLLTNCATAQVKEGVPIEKAPVLSVKGAQAAPKRVY